MSSRVIFGAGIRRYAFLPKDFSQWERKNLIKRHVTQSVRSGDSSDGPVAWWCVAVVMEIEIGEHPHRLYVHRMSRVCINRVRAWAISWNTNRRALSATRIEHDLVASTTKCTYIDVNTHIALTWFASNNILLRNLVPFNVFMYADNKNFIFRMRREVRGCCRAHVRSSCGVVCKKCPRARAIFSSYPFASCLLPALCATALRCVILILFIFTFNGKNGQFYVSFHNWIAHVLREMKNR